MNYYWSVTSDRCQRFKVYLSSYHAGHSNEWFWICMMGWTNDILIVIGSDIEKNQAFDMRPNQLKKNNPSFPHVAIDLGECLLNYPKNFDLNGSCFLCPRTPCSPTYPPQPTILPTIQCMHPDLSGLLYKCPPTVNICAPSVQSSIRIHIWLKQHFVYWHQQLSSF